MEIIIELEVVTGNEDSTKMALAGRVEFENGVHTILGKWKCRISHIHGFQ